MGDEFAVAAVRRSWALRRLRARALPTGASVDAGSDCLPCPAGRGTVVARCRGSTGQRQGCRLADDRAQVEPSVAFTHADPCDDVCGNQAW